MARPKVSLILLDWDCRESFHSLDYLARQDVPRGEYEIIWIEYYGRQAAQIDERLRAATASGEPPPVDAWIVMDMPAGLYYHKHLMYNIGIARARGEIVVICDSDAMFEPSFIRTIQESFAADPNIVLHMDQIRNARRDFYPFNFPSFEAMRGEGAINWLDGRTTGLLDTVDPLHTRNYGACMCAWREDLIAIGGADESLDYLGHVCGPYDLTFRLINQGRREVWHETHYIYHSWHPGTDGDLNYIGPSDGRNMSTTALAARKTRRVMPLKENEAIRLERTDAEPNSERRLERLIDPLYFQQFTKEAVARSPNFILFKRYQEPPQLVGEIGDYDLKANDGFVYAVPRYLLVDHLSVAPVLLDPRIRRFETVEAARGAVQESERLSRQICGGATDCDVAQRDGRWFAIPRTLPPIDMSDPVWFEDPEIVTAATQRELASAVVEWRRRAAEVRAAGELNALRTLLGSADGQAAETVLAKLDRIAAELEDIRRRIDRVGTIAERSQHGVAQVQHRLVHLELQMAGIVNNRIARFVRGLGVFRALRAIGLWGRAG